MSSKTADRSMYDDRAPEPEDMDPDRLAAEGVVRTDAGSCGTRGVARRSATVHEFLRFINLRS